MTLDILLKSDDQDIGEVLDREPESSSEESNFDDNVQVNAEIDSSPAPDMDEETPSCKKKEQNREELKGQ